MANNLDFNEGVINLSNITEYPNSFKRQGAFPLERFSVFNTIEALEDYVTNNPVAYVGQNITLINGDNTATMYIIQNDGTVEGVKSYVEVGKSLIGDESTIVVADDGTISLHGIDGLELERQDDEGNTTKINYQPLLVDGKLTWIEPSATTVEGLASEIEGIKTRLATLEGDGDGSVKKIAEKAADARVNEFATAISDDNVVNTFKELVDYVAEHGTEAADMAKDILTLQGLVGDTAVATQIVNAIDEALKEDNVDKYALAVDLASAVARINTLEEVGAEKNVIADTSDEFSVDDSRVLALKAVAMSKVTGLADALAKKVDAVTGKGLSTNDFTNTLKEKLDGIEAGANANIIEVIKAGGTALSVTEKEVDIPLATASALGLVKSSTAVNGVAVAADGTMSVNNINVDKLVQTEGDVLILDGGSAKE